MIRVLVADDHAVVRAGLAQLLGAFDGMELVGEATNGAEALELALVHQPDVVLMDLEMPLLDGIEATRRIHEESPETAVVVLTSFSD
ncbi:MAG: response regulator transcription factor, partial [Gaiellaceae bacterium]|nr:response regulator transcription factor [Gaiellaceae bacterium]